MNSDAGGKAVEVHSHASELREQLLESPLVSYAIVRTIDGKASEMAADENTPVLPGDVIKVATVLAPAD